MFSINDRHRWKQYLCATSKRTSIRNTKNFTASLSREFGTFEKHTKGFGMKMLKKVSGDYSNVRSDQSFGNIWSSLATKKVSVWEKISRVERCRFKSSNEKAKVPSGGTETKIPIVLHRRKVSQQSCTTAFVVVCLFQALRMVMRANQGRRKEIRLHHNGNGNHVR